MKIISCAILLALLTGTALGKAPEEPHKFQFTVSVSSHIFKNLTANELTSTFGLWAKTALKGKGLDENLEVDIFDGSVALKEMVRKGVYDCYIMASEDIDLGLISPKQVLIPLKAGEYFIQYVILVNKDNKDHTITTLSDLKNRKIVLYNGYGMNLAKFWLEHEFKTGTKKELHPEPLNLVETSKPMEGIYQVFFGQSDAVVVSLEAFKTACLLNPQLEQKLRILLRSSELVPMAFFFDPNSKGKNQDMLLDSIREMHLTPGGKQVLTIFQCTQVEQYPLSVLNDTLEFLREVRALQ